LGLGNERRKETLSGVGDLEHIAFLVNSVAEFIRVARFKPHRFVTKRTGQIVRMLRMIAVLAKPSSGCLYPRDERHWVPSVLRDAPRLAVGLPKP
jgi:hypothetical protein